MLLKTKLYQLSVCFLLAQIFMSGIAFAEVKEIIKEGVYIMIEGETPAIAEQRAIEDAKQNAVLEAGTYLESYTEIQNMQLKKDVVRAFAAAIIKATVIDKKTIAENGNVKYWVKLRCLVDPANIETLKSGMDYNKFLDDYARIQTENQKNKQEIEDLKRQLVAAKDAREINAIKEKIRNNEELFTSTQWFAKGLEYSNAGNNRGVSYARKGQDDLAIADYSKAIQLNPQFIDAYFNRGNSYSNKKQYDLAIADYSKIIQLNPQFAAAYSRLKPKY